MEHRERVRTALSHSEPDRLPLDLGGTFLSSAPEFLQKKMAEILGLQGQRDMRFKNFDNRIQEHFGCDLRSIVPGFSLDWGYKEVHEAPLRNATIAEIRSYPWPRLDTALLAGKRDEARFLHEETPYAICASQIGRGIFEAACYLRGYDQILIDLMIDPDTAHALFSMILETNLRLSEPWFKAVGDYLDLVLFGDDLAMQDRTYVAPDVFAELIKPYFRKYVACIKECCPNAIIMHHSCGATIGLFDQLVECGVGVHNPTQTRATGMDPANLQKQKPLIAFHGGIDLQYILPRGTTEEVKEFVRNLICKLAPGGGYIFAASHTLPEDVNPQNVITAFETAKAMASYPIRMPK